MTRTAVLTSGGDAPGMNAAVRGVVLAARRVGADVLGVLEGYQGLVEGRFTDFGDVDLDEQMREGGTFLGTARSEDFRRPEGRRRAVQNLIARGIDRLVVIGGDGSLSGAHVLGEEWDAHVQSLGEAAPRPAILGIAASIDNDLPGSDRTLGADSALHRAVEAIDALESTARSHARAFVVEVMGRSCGWLALTTALCTGADHVIVPEADNADWQERMVEALDHGRRRGRRQSIVVLAEGACDASGVRISTDEVADVVRERLQVDTRVTVLGHIQRGGAPSAIDRLHGDAAGRFTASWAPQVPEVLVSHGDDLERRPLVDALFNDTPASLRPLLELQNTLGGPEAQASGSRVLIAHVGAPAPGMNAAVRASVRCLLASGRTPVVARGGLVSILDRGPELLGWGDVEGWQHRSGTQLGTSRWSDLSAPQLASALQQHGVSAVMLIGGFGALQAAERIQLPCAVLPATISNNVPATDHSIGSDTALNRIADAVDGLRQSALGSRRRVFFVEVMGAHCGYLARTAGDLVGADVVYTPENPPDLDRVREDIRVLDERIRVGAGVGLVVVGDGLAAPWDTRTLASLYDASAEHFDTRVCVLGHLQQGSRPSPADRLLAARLAEAAVAHLKAGSGADVFGLSRGEVVRTPVDEALARSDRRLRRPSSPRRGTS